MWARVLLKCSRYHLEPFFQRVTLVSGSISAVLHKQASRMNRLCEQEQYRQERAVFVFQELTGAALVLSDLYLSFCKCFLFLERKNHDIETLVGKRCAGSTEAGKNVVSFADLRRQYMLSLCRWIVSVFSR